MITPTNLIIKPLNSAFWISTIVSLSSSIFLSLLQYTSGHSVAPFWDQYTGLPLYHWPQRHMYKKQLHTGQPIHSWTNDAGLWRNQQISYWQMMCCCIHTHWNLYAQSTGAVNNGSVIFNCIYYFVLQWNIVYYKRTL